MDAEPPRTTHEAEEDSRNRDIEIYVNGEILHRDDAKVSVYDSGFLLGDGMWEGMRLHNGKSAPVSPGPLQGASATSTRNWSGPIQSSWRPSRRRWRLRAGRSMR